MRLLLFLFVGAAGLLLARSAAAADCGDGLSAAVATVWRGLDGATGRLGCPTAKEAATAPSPSGATALESDFAHGAIVLWTAGSARAGQVYAIDGCFWRLWFQYGGATGWLGLPTSEARNTPDGQRQSFEGGEAWYSRASDTCEGEKA